MDALQLSRWTRFAFKGGIGKCVALHDCVAEEQGDLMFLKGDEITVLMQIPDEDDVYLGHCEGVVGRFAAASVQFTGKLKTPVITRRPSTSKSPRPRSLTPSHAQQPSPSSGPSLSRPSSREEDPLPLTHPTPSVAPSLSGSLPLGRRKSSLTSPKSDASVEPSHHDLVLTPSISYSSSSSAPEPASPLTPSDFFLEPHVRDKAAPSSFASENEHSVLESPILSLPQETDARKPPHLLISGPTPPSNSLGLVRARSRSSDSPVSNPPRDPSHPSPTRTEPSSLSGPSLSTGDFTGIHLSRLSSATSDGAAGIGLSMLNGFSFGNVDEDDDNDYSDHDHSSRSEPERTSIEETVDDFPAPPTQIPTPSSRSASFVLDAHRPTSSISESSEDGDGASFYDNYRYSRLSISSKMSKSSAQTFATVPPPIPTDPPPSVRHSQDSLSSALALQPEPSPSPESAPVSTPLTAKPATRTVPPPLVLEANRPLASITSPLLHTNFASPQSSPPTDPSIATMCSPISAVFDRRGSGAASVLRQRIESDRGLVSPLPSPLPSTTPEERTIEQFQSIVVKDTEDNDNVALAASGTQPQSPTSPIASSSHSKSEKKKRDGPSPLRVMNQAPPPPYTPTSPDALDHSRTFNIMPNHSPTLNVMPTPAIPHPPSEMVPEPGVSPSRTSLFLPHPNAPKPSATPQGPLYARTTSAVPPPPASLLIQMLQRAAQIHTGPNGLPRFNTIYAMTPQDLSMSPGPVPVYFSINPPKDVPANRMRIVTPTAQSSPPQTPVNIRPPAEGQALTPTSTVTAQTGIPPNAAAVRRRSRSFSGFDSSMTPGVPPKEQSRGKVATRPSTADSESRSNSLSVRAAVHTARLHQARKHTPSPLGLSQARPSSNESPLTITISVPPSRSHPNSLPSSPTVHRTISPAKSEPSLRGSQTRSVPERGAPPKSPADTAGSNQVVSSLSGSGPEDVAPLALIQSSASESHVSLASRGTLGKNQGSPSRQLSSELPGRTSIGADGSNHGEAHSQGTTPTPAPASSSLLGRSTSLRSKISLSALRARSSREDKRQDDGPGESETVQVRDMDFELVRPVARPLASEESPISDKNEGMPSFLRVDSPATSLASGTSGPRSPLSVTSPTPPGAATGTAVGVSASAVEAHRARELKWISAMASTPPTHARKSKKIRKLLQEGVPASVRYQVWAHLTDCKARRIEGLYVQLGDRGKVPARAEIQRDAQLCFPSDLRLSQPDGALTSLLQAYLTMVPDVQYSKGLAFIAGQLLIQSPEEDAFWIFISLMDLHLRPYFSVNATQLEIDASLFAKTMEAIDPSIAKKLFTEMGIAPVRVCQPWFTSLFVETLPSDYFQRVWDIFLSEGMVFLLRVGLALVTCCRRTLLDIHQEAEALTLLLHPPPFLISSSPDLLIELANSFRLKDDDIRKQRVKLEAQAKRKTQSRLSNAIWRGSNNGNRARSASISLPRS